MTWVRSSYCTMPPWGRWSVGDSGDVVVVDAGLDEQAHDEARQGVRAVELLGELGVEAVADEPAVGRALLEGRRHPGRPAPVRHPERELVGQCLVDQAEPVVGLGEDRVGLADQLFGQ